MKSRILTLLFLIAVNTVFFAQKCKVKDDNLNKKYEGECKKGLAHGYGKAWGEDAFFEGEFRKGVLHGNGVYVWKNGNKYSGHFVKGKFEGKGELIKADLVQKGYFKKGKYIGEYKTPYKVISKKGIRTVSFLKQQQDINEVEIRIFNNGVLINTDVRIIDTNNTFVENNGSILTMKDIKFPLKKVELFFTVDSFSYSLNFEIYQKGNWQVNISL